MVLILFSVIFEARYSTDLIGINFSVCLRRKGQGEMYN